MEHFINNRLSVANAHLIQVMNMNIELTQALEATIGELNTSREEYQKMKQHYSNVESMRVKQVTDLTKELYDKSLLLEKMSNENASLKKVRAEETLLMQNKTNQCANLEKQVATLNEKLGKAGGAIWPQKNAKSKKSSKMKASP